MLQTEYYEHQHEDGGFEALCDLYHLPEHVRSHIDYSTPAVKGSDVTGRIKRSGPHSRSSEHFMGCVWFDLCDYCGNVLIRCRYSTIATSETQPPKPRVRDCSINPSQRPQ